MGKLRPSATVDLLCEKHGIEATLPFVEFLFKFPGESNWCGFCNRLLLQTSLVWASALAWIARKSSLENEMLESDSDKKPAKKSRKKTSSKKATSTKAKESKKTSKPKKPSAK